MCMHECTHWIFCVGILWLNWNAASSAKIKEQNASTKYIQSQSSYTFTQEISFELVFGGEQMAKSVSMFFTFDCKLDSATNIPMDQTSERTVEWVEWWIESTNLNESASEWAIDGAVILVLNFRLLFACMPENYLMSFFRQQNHELPLNGTIVYVCVCVCVFSMYYLHSMWACLSLSLCACVYNVHVSMCRISWSLLTIYFGKKHFPFELSQINLITMKMWLGCTMTAFDGDKE